STGSKGLARPRQLAVAGMNCATPCAPAGLTAAGSKRLSCQISLVKKSTGKSFSTAAAARALQMLSTAAGALDGVGAGDWVLSTGWISPVSPSPAWARQSLVTTGVAPLGGPVARKTETNKMSRNADPAKLRMFVRPWIPYRRAAE